MPTAIEWTNETWNPVTGCSKVSPGCANCYAETIAKRFGGTKAYPAFRPWTPENAAHNVVLRPERLEQPPRWRKPRMVFVNSMSDLFHELVPDDFLARVWSVMDATPQHIYQVLTKRPERARDWLREWYGHNLVDPGLIEPPSENVWLGVSIENARHTWRADVLREIPAAVRFLSCEPLLGSLFTGEEDGKKAPLLDGAFAPEAPTRVSVSPLGSSSAAKRKPLDLIGIDWVIVGGESGPGARPCDVVWIREIRDAVRSCDPEPALFVKQLGSRPIKSYDVDGHKCSASVFGIRDRKGGDIDEWPADLRIREFPAVRA